MFLSGYITLFHIDLIGICVYLGYLGIHVCTLGIFTKSFGFFFLISNSRGPVPAPLTSGLHYYTTLEELRKSFDLCEDYFKPPFGPYPEKR